MKVVVLVCERGMGQLLNNTVYYQFQANKTELAKKSQLLSAGEL